MGSDYCMQTIARWETINGVEVPVDDSGYYLDWTEVNDDRTEARDLTSPYGSLYFAAGNGEGDERPGMEDKGDLFTCFDYAMLPDGRYVLHAVVNSESGGFIEGAGYEVVTKEQAADIAYGMVDEALERLWFNEIYHDEGGWNQSPDYFARCVEAHTKGEPSPPRHLTK